MYHIEDEIYALRKAYKALVKTLQEQGVFDSVQFAKNIGAVQGTMRREKREEAERFLVKELLPKSKK